MQEGGRMGNNTILYNFASRERPNAFFTVLDNIREMSAQRNYAVVLKLDLDDPLRFMYMDRLPDYPEVVLRAWANTSKIDAINRDITDKGWGILVNISDDQRFIVKGFDDIIRKECEGNTSTFLHFPDPYKKAACSTMSIFTRDYWLCNGRKVYEDDYYSLWADVEATEVAKLLGCYKYVPQQIFDHLHYSTGAVKDALYKRNDTYKRDKLTYLKRRALNFNLPIPADPFLLIKYPTRGRWRLFAEGLDNIYSTIRTNQFKIVVSADEDDCEMNSPEVRDLCRRYNNVELHYGPPVSKIEACNRDMDNATNWQWSVLYSDDMRFKTFGWDYKMLEDIRKVWPEGWDWFAHFNDGYVGSKLPTLNICGRAWYDRFGYLYHPSYKSVSCDAENMFVAQMNGRYNYFENIYFNHDHPANLKQPSDYIYRRNHAYGKEDTDNYFERLKRLFDVKDPVMIPEEIKPFL